MALFGYDNAFDLSSTALQATNETTSLPVTNLADSDVSTEVFRATSSKTVIDLDAGTDITRRLTVFPNINVTSNVTVTLEAGSSQGASDVTSSTSFKLSEAYRILVQDLGQDYTARWWRWTIEDTNRPRLQIGRGALLKVLPISLNIAPPYGIQPISLTTVKRMRGQQIRRYQRQTYYGGNAYKRLTFPWGIGLDETDALAEIIANWGIPFGQGQDIFFVQDLSAATWDTQAIWGVVTALPTMTQEQPVGPTFSGDFEIEEQI